MRFLWVGLFLAALCSTLYAQAEGEVESVGFEGYYRTDCWVPMTVRLRPTTEQAEDLQIRVIQEDADRDRVLAVRKITLTPATNGRSVDQRFWMYFRPQPSGLSDAAVGGSSKLLDQQLKVVLANKNGKPIANLPLTSLLKRVDVNAFREAGTRLVLCVSDGMSLPKNEYNQVQGLSARPIFVIVRPRDLPEDVRGYEMIDGMLWMGAAAPDPGRATEEPRYRAIEQYVRGGGMLVVCQGAEINATKGFAQILPVKVEETRDSEELRPLLDMGRLGLRVLPEAKMAWRVGIASLKPGSLVLREKTWPQQEEGKSATTPYIVRGAVGAGCVTWVAQDLGEATTVRALRGGWVRIWDEIFGWRNTPVVPPEDQNHASAYGNASGVTDLGGAFQGGGQLSNRASGYILVAVLFFLIYWLAAGPGMYAWLAFRRMATWNWFLFGVAAVVAAMLAGLVVRLVQSASPRLEHVTILKAVAGEPAIMESRVGLYVPSDGDKRLELERTAPNTVNWITSYPDHPDKPASSGKFLAIKQYELPIQDAANNEPVRMDIPWRSTMKRLQVRWAGDWSARIEGKIALAGRRNSELSGMLTNGTGWDLAEIYLVYRGNDMLGDGSNAGGDRVLYLPVWPKGTTLDLAKLFRSEEMYPIGHDFANREAEPRQKKMVVGGMELIHNGYGDSVPFGEGWVGYWYSRDRMTGGLAESAIADAAQGYYVSLPLCSLFDRVPPMRNGRKGQEYVDNRHDLSRVGARWMNVSPAVAAGELVVLAEAHEKLPVPLTVDGKPLEGDGTIICQFILPLHRGSAGDGNKGR